MLIYLIYQNVKSKHNKAEKSKKTKKTIQKVPMPWPQWCAVDPDLFGGVFYVMLDTRLY
jgi:hypothetical protein